MRSLLILTGALLLTLLLTLSLMGCTCGEAVYRPPCGPGFTTVNNPSTVVRVIAPGTGWPCARARPAAVPLKCESTGLRGLFYDSMGGPNLILVVLVLAVLGGGIVYLVKKKGIKP